MRLILLCHGPTASMRSGGFPAPDEPIDRGASRKLAMGRVAAAAAVTGPDLAARQTAGLLGFDAAEVDALRDIDHGSWSGQSFAEVHAEAPAAFEAWLRSPWTGAPDGESFAAARARAAAWIETLTGQPSPLLAVVSPMIARAVLAAAIGIAAPAVMRIDIAPLATVVLSRHRGWRLQQLGGAIGDDERDE